MGRVLARTHAIFFPYYKRVHAHLMHSKVTRIHARINTVRSVLFEHADRFLWRVGAFGRSPAGKEGWVCDAE